MFNLRQIYPFELHAPYKWEVYTYMLAEVPELRHSACELHIKIIRPVVLLHKLFRKIYTDFLGQRVEYLYQLMQSICSRTALALQSTCSWDHKVSMTLQTQVARPRLAAAAAWSLSWMEEPDHQRVCQRTRTPTEQQGAKKTKTPEQVTLHHWSEPPRPAGLLWGLRPRRSATFPLTCSTSLLNYKWINRAARSRRMKQRSTECAYWSPF